MSIALFPGTFDPFTVGHKSVVDRALQMFSEVIIAVGINDSKHTMYTTDERIAAIRKVYASNANVRVVSYQGLTVEAVKRLGADCMLRGVRSVQDFEYERTLADVNREIAGIETVLLYTLPEHAHISSSVVRELLRHGYDVRKYIP